MKKVLAIVLCVAMIACCAVSALAEGETASFAASADKKFAKAGDTVKITVALTEGTLNAINLFVDYDKTKVEPVAASWEDVNALGLMGMPNIVDDQLKASYAAIKAPATTGDLFVCSFKLLDAVVDKEELTFTLTGDGEVTVGTSNNPLTCTMTNAVVTVGGPAEATAKVIEDVENMPAFEDDNRVALKALVDTYDALTTEEKAFFSPEQIKKIEDAKVFLATTPSVPAPVSSVVESQAAVVSTPAASNAGTSSNPKTGDAGVIAFAAVIAVAAGAAFVASKKRS